MDLVGNGRKNGIINQLLRVAERTVRISWRTKAGTGRTIHIFKLFAAGVKAGIPHSFLHFWS